LTLAGYFSYGTSHKDYSLHHHLSPMFHPKWNIPIETYRKILSYPFLDAIKCKETNCQKTIVDRNAYTLNPTLRLIHAYMHSDILD